MHGHCRRYIKQTLSKFYFFSFDDYLQGYLSHREQPAPLDGSAVEGVTNETETEAVEAAIKEAKRFVHYAFQIMKR